MRLRKPSRFRRIRIIAGLSQLLVEAGVLPQEGGVFSLEEDDTGFQLFDHVSNSRSNTKMAYVIQSGLPDPAII